MDETSTINTKNHEDKDTAAKTDPYSYLKVFRHHEKLESIRNKVVTPPLYIRIKPINICNHHCYYCSYEDANLGLRSTFKEKDKLPQEMMLGIIRDLADMKVKAVTFSGGGEPLLYAHIVEAMTKLLEHGINISIITNGQLLCNERAQVLRNAKWVRVSMDSCHAEKYAKIRSIPEKAFYIVAENIKNFSQIKSPQCELGMNFVVNSENADEVYEMAKFAKGLGVDHIKMSAVITKDLESLHEPFRYSVVDQIHRAQKDFNDDKFQVVNKYEFDFELNAQFSRSYSRCPIQQSITVIGADGRVYLCHDKAYVPGGDIGSLHEMSFKDIWFSEKTRQRFHNFDAKKECNHHCVYDQRNILINSYLDLDEDQINFV